MSLLIDLQTITNNQQTKELFTATNFFSGAGRRGIEDYLKAAAKEGRTSVSLHFEKGVNPYSRHSSFATLSGELSIINAPAAVGVQDRNEIGWIYMGIPAVTQTDFELAVTSIINYLVSEGLTITGTTMAQDMADTRTNW